MSGATAAEAAEGVVVAFPERLRRLREAAGLTQEQLAELAEVSARAVSRYETGVAIPDLRIFCKLAWVLRVNLDQFVEVG